MVADESALYREYRDQIDTQVLGPALKNAVLTFFLLQTLVFIPADWVLYREHFDAFLVARLALNAALGVIWFGTATRWPAASSVAVCALGTALFLFMVDQTGGVISGYYVGLILLVVGMGFLTPQTVKQSGFIAGSIFVSYAALPLYNQDPINGTIFAENLFFLGAACAEAWWASLHMERMRFADFCQKRELERARDDLAELDQAKSRFSSNVHHELRTPLTLILAPLDTLRSGDLGALPEAVQKTLSTMHSNGRRLHKMINNLLDLSRIESHEFVVVRRLIDVRELIDELIAGAQPMADRKRISLRVQGLDGLPQIHADADALEKIFVNLLGNALKFTEEGGRIDLGARALEGGLEFRISDDGIGIPQDKLDTIFDRFAQVDASATRRFEGTGIGLSLVREMVERHEGWIRAESDGPDQGTTLTMWLPLGQPDADSAEEVMLTEEGDRQTVRTAMESVRADLQMSDSESSGADFHQEMERVADRWSDAKSGAAAESTEPEWTNAPEVLIAEDNPDMRALLATLVGQEFRVRTAKNGREALEKLDERLPDLLLSDVMMPVMSGLELCREVKQNPATRALPVVLVTSKAERDMKIEGLELGADDYVTKPFHPRELMARVRSLVRVVSLQKQLSRRNASLESALDELKQAEVQLVQSERLAAVGELAAGIAHEVNNPVNFALNSARTLEAVVQDFRSSVEDSGSEAPSVSQRSATTVDDLASDVVELAEIIREGLSRTASLVGDLRDFSSPGQLGTQIPGVQVEKGLRSTLQLVRHDLEKRGAEIHLSIEEGLPSIVGDISGLNQVFLNLLKNAGEALGPAGGRIDVSLTRHAGELVVEVSDDGMGIRPDHLNRLFEPFFTTKDTGEGTGLGLSISRRIVAAHGGRIEVASASGEGTRFSVHLPISREAAGKFVGEGEESAPSGG